jgi:hypothetical protein
MCHVIGSMWHGLDLAYVPCGMSYAMLRCHVGWLRPSLCATWHGLGLTYVTCHMPCQDATWHGLGLTYVPCGMVET